MINEEVERRVAGYYMGLKMSESQFIELEGALLDAIWKSDEQISDDELVKIGVNLINRFLEEEV
jgi:hypothetical protein